MSEWNPWKHHCVFYRHENISVLMQHSHHVTCLPLMMLTSVIAKNFWALPDILSSLPAIFKSCTTQVGGAQCRPTVHNIVLYHWSGAQRRFHKPISLLTDRQTPTEPVWLLRLLPWERKMLHQFTLAERDWFPLKGGAFWVPVLLSYLLSLLKWGYATLQEKWGEASMLLYRHESSRARGDSVHQVCASNKNFSDSIRPRYPN